MGVLKLGTETVTPAIVKKVGLFDSGIPREVSAQGVYQVPSTSFTFSLPSNVTTITTGSMVYSFLNCTGLTSVDMSGVTTVSGDFSMTYAFQDCTNLTSVDLSSLTSVLGSELPSGNIFGGAMQYAFQNCTSLVYVDLSSLTTIDARNSMMAGCMQSTFQRCKSLTSIDLSSLTTINGGTGNYALNNTFSGCTNLSSVDLSSLSILNGSLSNCFYGCTSLATLSFPSLNSASFGNKTNQFNNMLRNVTGCTVHFPSNLQSVIGSWSDVTVGFGGTNTTVLFDLPATT